MENKSYFRTLSAMLLVGGTCVGGGILGLPVEAGKMGFFPSLVVLFFCWLFMTSTGLLYAEASLWMKEEDAHVVTLSKKLLGRFGEFVSVVLYLFMGYASLVAYNSGGSLLIINIVEFITGYGIDRWAACIVFAAVFGSIFYLGARVLGAINSLFVIGMVVTYIGMVGTSFDDIRRYLLVHSNWSQFYFVIPLMVTSFSFQMIVPSLALYLDHDAKALRNSILFGTTIPLVAYALWLLIVMGIVPITGPMGLAEALEKGNIATESLKAYTKSTMISTLAEFFAIFAIVTSYLGIGLGLFDFLADLTKIKKKRLGKFLLGLLVIIPTLYFTVLFPEAFLFALDITGGFGDSILSGLIPVLMVWIGRYVIGHEGEYQFTGGKATLSVLFAASIAIFCIQIVKLFV